MQESIVFLLRVQCRRKESSRSLSHLLMSFLVFLLLSKYECCSYFILFFERKYFCFFFCFTSPHNFRFYFRSLSATDTDIEATHTQRKPTNLKLNLTDAIQTDAFRYRMLTTR